MGTLRRCVVKGDYMGALATKVAGTTTMVSEYMSTITNPFENLSSEDLLKGRCDTGKAKFPGG